MDVAESLRRLKEKEEIEEYVKSGKYPERLKEKMKKVYIPELDEKEIKEYVYEGGVYEEMNKILSSLKKIEIELRREDECPICMREIEEKNYVMPKCGHRVCINCFVENMKRNKMSGEKCSICRGNLL
jgi:hypothetical protein